MQDKVQVVGLEAAGGMVEQPRIYGTLTALQWVATSFALLDLIP